MSDIDQLIAMIALDRAYQVAQAGCYGLSASCVRCGLPGTRLFEVRVAHVPECFCSECTPENFVEGSEQPFKNRAATDRLMAIYKRHT